MSYEKDTYQDNPNIPSRNPFTSPPVANGFEGPTSELFEERKFYRDDVFNEFILGNDNLIDYWNKQNFYGRINKEGMPIICNENSLKAITSAQEGSNPLALNFVADAFDDMSDSFARLRQQGGASSVNDDSIFYPLEAISGWVSARDDYAQYISGIFDGFVNGYLRIDTEENRKVVDFSTFLNAFYKFTQLAIGGSPLTFSSFVLSSACSPASNGMVIEVYEGDSDDDFSKFTECLSDSNFELYRKLAQNHGFLLDKNIPWRLGANLNHPYMLKKQKLNGFFGENNNLDQIFTFAFAQPHREDIDMLRIHLAGFYSTFIETFTEVRLPVDKLCNGRRQVKTKVVSRKPLENAFYSDGSFNPNSAYVKDYGDLFWLRFYLYLKTAELSRDPVHFKDLDRQVKTLYNYYGIHGLTKTIDLINKKTFRRTRLRTRNRS